MRTLQFKCRLHSEALHARLHSKPVQRARAAFLLDQYDHQGVAGKWKDLGFVRA